MIKLKVILFVGVLLGWTYGLEMTTEMNIDMELVTESIIPEESQTIMQTIESSSTTDRTPTALEEDVKNSTVSLSPSPKTIDEVFRIAQKEAENEVIESLSPGDFIFNSCELRKYQPSNDFQQKFPYYLSGFDSESRPIWVVEMGKFSKNLHSVIGGKNSSNFEDFAKDVVYNFIKSLFIKSGSGRPTFDFIFIIDFEGFSKEHITVDNVLLVLKLARQYTQLLEEYAYSVVIINVNDAANSLGPAVRPYAVDVLDKVSIFGKDRSKWMAYLRQTIPPTSLPSFYGGTDPAFKPVKIFG